MQWVDSSDKKAVIFSAEANTTLKYTLLQSNPGLNKKIFEVNSVFAKDRSSRTWKETQEFADKVPRLIIARE